MQDKNISKEKKLSKINLHTRSNNFQKLEQLSNSQSLLECLSSPKNTKLGFCSSFDEEGKGRDDFIKKLKIKYDVIV